MTYLIHVWYFRFKSLFSSLLKFEPNLMPWQQKTLSDNQIKEMKFSQRTLLRWKYLKRTKFQIASKWSSKFCFWNSNYKTFNLISVQKGYNQKTFLVLEMHKNRIWNKNFHIIFIHNRLIFWTPISQKYNSNIVAHKKPTVITNVKINQTWSWLGVYKQN